MATTSERLSLHEAMVRIRAVETVQNELWERGLISGEMHTGIGEEGIIAGVAHHLGAADAIACDHRPTGAFIAAGVPPREIILEMLGRDDGLCGGWGGHMHLMSEPHLAISDGIVGAAGPAACGFALSAKRLRPGSIAVAYFGEGATNQGMLMEAYNLARVWRLPVLFVCKDNGWSITTRSREMLAGTVARRARSFGLRTAAVNGSDVGAVARRAGSLIEYIRRSNTPAFLHARCRRPDGHFLGDPLLRVFAEPVEQTKELGLPLAEALQQPEGGPRPAQARAMVGLGGRLATLGLDRVGLRRWDPIARSRRGIDRNMAAGVERRVRYEVDRLLDDVLAPSAVTA